MEVVAVLGSGLARQSGWGLMTLLQAGLASESSEDRSDAADGWLA